MADVIIGKPTRRSVYEFEDVKEEQQYLRGRFRPKQLRLRNDDATTWRGGGFRVREREDERRVETSS